MRLWPLMLALALAPGCYLSHERVDREPCSTAPAERCTTWESAGPTAWVTEPLPGADFPEFGSAIARDCGVLVGWGLSRRDVSGSSARIQTRVLDWSGAPTAPALEHPLLARTDPMGNPTAILASGPGGAGALVDGFACVFVPLDLDGRERGAPVPAADGSCGALAGTDDGYSYLTPRPSSTEPVELRSVDGGGAVSLPVALFEPSLRSVWSRIVFDDGSFLLYSYSWDFLTPSYVSHLRHFDRGGAPLAPAVEIGEDATMLTLAPTARGAIAVWMAPLSGGLPLRIRAVDRDGRPSSDTRDLPAEGALYGLGIAPTQDGGAVVTWLESHFTPGLPDEWRLRVLALDEDGDALGDVTTLPGEPGNQTLQILVEPGGARALVLSANDVGVHAQPLTCAR